MGSDASKSAGIAWYFGRSTIDTPGDYEWVGGRGSAAGLVSPPESVGCTVDPFEVAIQGSSQHFKIHATDTAKALWLYRPAEPDDLLNTEIESDTTTIVFAGNATWSASDDGKVVWLRDEAIRLGTWSAGSTFTGCTRGHWGTAGMLQNKGVHVYRYNPRRVHRLAKILLYDHDTGTVAQAWQGFVSSISISGPVISVQCTDLISAIRGAKVNRGAPTNLRSQISGTLSSELQTINGAVNMRDGTRGQRRVNKANATSPHYVAIQTADALFYANWSGNIATFSDDTDVSTPQLGSTIDEGDFGWNEPTAHVVDNVYELLVVDDRDVLQTGGQTAYATRRSSSRDLDKPLHPVTLTTALWTSGPDNTPGFPGSGASGVEDAPVGAFGLTSAQYNDQDLYYAWRATPAQTHSIVGAGPEADPPTDTTIADAGDVETLIDASPSGWYSRYSVGPGGTRPEWEETPSYLQYSAQSTTSGIEFMYLPRSREGFRFLNETGNNYTVIWVGAINTDIATTGGALCGTYSGSNRGFVFNMGTSPGPGADVVQAGVRSTTAFSSASFTFSSFATNTVYRLACRMTSGSMEIFQAAEGATFGTAKNSATITTFEAGLPQSDFTLMGRSQSSPHDVINGEHMGFVVCKRALTVAQMDAFAAWIEAGAGN